MAGLYKAALISLKEIFMKKFYSKILAVIVLLILVPLLNPGCTEENNTLAPYVGSPVMSNIMVEPASFKPKITWVGGYASVVGVNRGTRAALDSSLVWLIHSSEDNIHYPVTFGDAVAGTEDLTSQYGGTKADTLSEDETYTFWVMKAELWTQISSQSGKILQIDSSISQSQFTITGDTIFVGTELHSQKSGNLDVFINIENVVAQGRLGQISVTATNSNRPIVSWTITEEGVDDTLFVSAIGLVEGQQFNNLYMLWDMYSVTDSAGTQLYGRENVIPKPLQIGDAVPGTIVFKELEGDLERGKAYYIWIASKHWDRNNRTRFAPGYCYATFNVR